MLRFRSTYKNLDVHNSYNVGDKVGQLVIMPIPSIELIEVQELETSDRMEKGFGSSGN